MLVQAVKTAKYLRRRCDKLGLAIEETRSFALERLREYQAIKESADDFTAWANELKC